MPSPPVSTEPVPVVVLCADGAEAPPQLHRLDASCGWRITDADGLSAAMPGARVLLMWDFFSPALRQVWPHCDALEWVHVAAAGVDSLLFPELRDSEVMVTNARGVFEGPIAEYVLAQVLAHAKQLRRNDELQRAHQWRHRETQRVAGQHALIVGTGPIGAAIAALLRAVGLEVRAAGRTSRSGDPRFGDVVSSSELADHVGWADYVVNAAPLTPATRDLFDASVFAAMRESGYFINVGRGASVDEDALRAALRGGTIAGAALDVFTTEPVPADSELWDLPGLAISAHMCGDVIGWRDALADQFVENLTRWLAGQPLGNVVDKHLGYVKEKP